MKKARLLVCAVVLLGAWFGVNESNALAACDDVVDNKCVVTQAEVKAQRSYAVACMRDKANCDHSSDDGEGLKMFRQMCKMAPPPLTFTDQVVKEGLWHRFQVMTGIDNVYASLARGCSANNGAGLKAALKKVKGILYAERPTGADETQDNPVFSFSSSTGTVTIKVPTSRTDLNGDGPQNIGRWVTQHVQ